MVVVLPQRLLQLHLRHRGCVTSDTVVVLPEAWQQRYLRHGSGVASGITMLLPQTQQQTPWSHLPHHIGVNLSPRGGATAIMAAALPQVLPQAQQWCYLRCYCKHADGITSGVTAEWRRYYLRIFRRHGDSVTSGFATVMAAALPQSTLRLCTPGPVSPGQRGTNHLHPPGSLQPPRGAGWALVSY